MGAVAFCIITFAFFNRNRVAKIKYKKIKVRQVDFINDSNKEYAERTMRSYYLALALQGAFVIYLVNGLFYDILYMHWFSDLLILNTLVYQISRKNTLNDLRVTSQATG